MNMITKIISVLLVVCMFVCLFTATFAASNEAYSAAEELHELGLFNGIGTDEDGNPIYDLDRTPTRAEAVTMLVNLLGKSEEAKEGTWTTPFTDVPEWAKPYVGYAYENGLTTGTSATTFGSKVQVSASQYLSFVLNALGYVNGKDFKWNKAWELSDIVGLTNGEYNLDTKSFTRGDIAIISLSAIKLQKTLDYSTYMGLDENMRFITDCESVEDLYNNVFYYYLIGKYALNGPINYSILEKGFVKVDFARDVKYLPFGFTANNVFIYVTKTHPELGGAYVNCTSGLVINQEDAHIFFDNPTLTSEEIFDNNIEAIEKALTIKEQLHNSDRIKDEMTQKQIAQVYYDYLRQMNVKVGDGARYAANGNRGKCCEYDSAYACLVNKTADCVGRAAAFNLFMNIEGIPAQGISGQLGNSGHVLNRVVLDGVEYFCDWGNGVPLNTDVYSIFTPNESSLELARVMG